MNDKMGWFPPLEEALGHTPQIKILCFMMAHKFNDYSIQEIAKSILMTRQTVSQSIKSLIRYKLIKENRMIGHTTLYKFDVRYPQAKAMQDLNKELIKIIVAEEKK